MNSNFLNDDYISTIEFNRDMNIEKNTYLYQIREITKTQFDGVREHLNSLIPSKVLSFSKQDIDTILKELIFGVSKTIYFLNNGIYRLMTYDNHMINYSMIADRIAYAIIFIASKRVLSNLMWFVERDYIFQYIKSHIILPNIKEIINQIRELEQKDSITIKMEHTDLVKKKFEECILTLLIKQNKQEFLQLVTQNYSLFIENIDTVNNCIQSSPFIIPDCIQKIFLTTDDDIHNQTYMMSLETNIREFMDKYAITHTYDGFKTLIRNYTTLNSYDEVRIKKLYDDVSSSRSLGSNILLIDGVTVEELYTINKILLKTTSSKIDFSKFENKTILENINYISKFFNTKTDSLILQGSDLLKHYRNSEIINTYNFRSDLMIKDLTSIFNVFGKDSLEIKKIFEEDPNKSILTQSVEITNKNNKPPQIFTLNISSIESRIRHRRKSIEALKYKYRSDSNVQSKISRIMSDPYYRYSYIKDPFKSGTIYTKDDKRALFILLEIEKIYNEAIKEIPIKESVKTNEVEMTQEDKLNHISNRFIRNTRFASNNLIK